MPTTSTTAAAANRNRDGISALPPRPTTKPPFDNHTHIARIPLDLRAHKLPIFLAWSAIFTSSCLLPLIGYFSLHYCTTLKVEYILSIFTPIFGAVSLFSFITRTIRLARPTSIYRPLGSTSAWTLDYFNWNFAFGLVVVSALITAGIASKPSKVRIVSLPLVVLLLQVCGQLILVSALRAARLRAPFRISSYGRGELLRPACYTIAEDVVAVDGKLGDVFREQWNARWESSSEFRRLLEWLDVLWGVGGLCVAGLVFGVVFGVGNESVGWGVGWSLPWVWAVGMVRLTVVMAGGLCRRENEGALKIGV